MITKLEERLAIEDKKLISIKSCDKYIRNYSQTLKYFRENAQTVTDEIYKTTQKEKEN